MPLELVKPTRKGVAVARSFGKPVTISLRCAKRLPVTPPAQRRRCDATRWQPTTCSSSCTPTPSVLLERCLGPVSGLEERHGEVVALAVRLGERLFGGSASGDGGSAQRHPGAGNGSHPERRAKMRLGSCERSTGRRSGPRGGKRCQEFVPDNDGLSA